MTTLPPATMLQKTNTYSGIGANRMVGFGLGNFLSACRESHIGQGRNLDAGTTIPPRSHSLGKVLLEAAGKGVVEPDAFSYPFRQSGISRATTLDQSPAVWSEKPEPRQRSLDRRPAGGRIHGAGNLQPNHIMNTFKLGDTVTWTSQSQGTMKTKIGHVIQIVPRGKRPMVVPELLNRWGMGRDEESYVVQVPTKKSHRIYWPNVSALKLA